MITPNGAFLLAWCAGLLLSLVVTRALKREQEAVRAYIGDVRHFDDARGTGRFLRFVWTSAPTVVRSPQARLAIYALRAAHLLFVATFIWNGWDMFVHPLPPR